MALKKWAAVLLGIILFISSPAMAQTVGMGTSAAGSWTYSVGSAIAKVATEKSGIQMRVQPMGGSNTFIQALNAGQIEFSIGTDFEAFLAWDGDGMVYQKANPNLQLVAVMSPMRVGAFVRKDSPLRSMKDMRGKRISGGYTTQKIVLKTNQALLANGDLSYDDVKMVPAPNVLRASEDFQTGKTDMLYFAIGSARIMQVSAKVGGVRLLPLDPSPEAWARVRKFAATAYPILVEPAPHLQGVMEPTTTLAYDFVLITNANVSPDIVYNVTKALYENKAELVATFKPLEAFSQKEMAKKDKVVPYHPGAIKFYEEKGLWPPK